LEGAKLAGNKMNERILELTSSLKEAAAKSEFELKGISSLEDELALMKERLGRVTVLACSRGADLSD